MNRRDFEIVIRAINSVAGDLLEDRRRRLVHAFAREIEAADGCSGFNREKFLERCGVKP